jgi:hypothetical protein
MRGYDAAELILQAIEDNPGGLNMRMLLLEAGVTPGQYRSAYTWTLDNYDEPIWVKRWVGNEFVYMLSDNALAAAEDWHRTIKTQVTRARREHNKIHMIAKQHPTLDNRLSVELARTRLEQLKIEKDRLRSE